MDIVESVAVYLGFFGLGSESINGNQDPQNEGKANTQNQGFWNKTYMYFK